MCLWYYEKQSNLMLLFLFVCLCIKHTNHKKKERETKKLWLSWKLISSDLKCWFIFFFLANKIYLLTDKQAKWWYIIKISCIHFVVGGCSVIRSLGTEFNYTKRNILIRSQSVSLSLFYVYFFFLENHFLCVKVRKK